MSVALGTTRLRTTSTFQVTNRVKNNNYKRRSTRKPSSDRGVRTSCYGHRTASASRDNGRYYVVPTNSANNKWGRRVHLVSRAWVTTIVVKTAAGKSPTNIVMGRRAATQLTRVVPIIKFVTKRAVGHGNVATSKRWQVNPSCEWDDSFSSPYRITKPRINRRFNTQLYPSSTEEGTSYDVFGGYPFPCRVYSYFFAGGEDWDKKATPNNYLASSTDVSRHHSHVFSSSRNVFISTLIPADPVVKIMIPAEEKRAVWEGARVLPARDERQDDDTKSKVKTKGKKQTTEKKIQGGIATTGQPILCVVGTSTAPVNRQAIASATS
ncbi:hypothetical protein K435DRAFT_802499 [Dendrothele bispora CBS 962.96]|uniref:Uncharacterized protein n=1 Tax=Dendrothele bispora (strain CBS 962.96) TaxID=1314807 RepID=A0A4V4HE57_DENBC|nr:hypothetical protein K435DRAFT_802499 [Dendrothele bispora CBS 962.96]